MHGGSVEPKQINQSIVSDTVHARHMQSNFNGNIVQINNTISSGDNHKNKSPLKLSQNQIDNKSTERVDQ